MSVKPILEGYQSVIPYITTENVAGLIDFLKQTFHVTERHKMMTPDGRIGHAEVQLNDCIIMMGQSSENMKAMPVSLYVYVSNTDAVYNRALAAGATSMMEPANMFYGDRNAGVKDSSGNVWWIGTRIEDLSPEEMKRREQEWNKQTMAV